MAEISKPIYGSVWASDGERAAPEQVKMTQGWIREMMPYQYENYLQHRQDVAITYLLQKGVPEWDDSSEYIAQKSFVQRNGVIYLAKVTQTGQPVTDTANWKRVSTLSDDNGVVSIAGGGTGSNTVQGARNNLGLGTAALLNADNVVQHDGSGNFTATTITASLNGNASTSDKWKTSRTITLAGGATSPATSFDGSANFTVTISSLDSTFLTGVVPIAVLSNAVIKTSETGSAKIPSGESSQRPTSPVFGEFRGNKTTTLMEYWNGTAWVSPSAFSAEYVVNRANHTGTQPMSTIDGLEEAIEAAAYYGGATGAGGDRVFYENDNVVNHSFVITRNTLTTGPIELAEGVSVEISEGVTWVIA